VITYRWPLASRSVQTATVDCGNLQFDLAAAASATAETPRHGIRRRNQRETVLRRRGVGYLTATMNVRSLLKPERTVEISIVDY